MDRSMQENSNNKPKTTKKERLHLPVIALRGLVAFPQVVFDLEIGRANSRKAVDAAIKGNRKVLLVAQRDETLMFPKEKDLYKIGVICELRQAMHSRENMHILVEGVSRAKITNLTEPDESTPYWHADCQTLPLYKKFTESDEEIEAVLNVTKEAFKEYCSRAGRIPRDFINSVMAETSPKELFAAIWSNVTLDYRERQLLLEENDMMMRLTMLFASISKAIEVMDIEMQLNSTVQLHMEQGQREMLLREQMRAIAEELGEDAPGEGEEQNYADKIDKLNASEEVRKKLKKEANQLAKMPPTSQEAYVIQNYLDVALSLPWGQYTTEKLDIQKAEVQLDKDHYGLKRVKERVLEAMSVHAICPNLTGQIVCLVGPPGVGKTSIAKSIAAALGRKFVRISLGGVRDEAEIRGHRKTYVAAMPGRILEAMRQAKSMNPLILLDEIDKLSGDFKGDPAAALLEVLDSEQNHEFRDHYLELPFDLSQVMFLTTANNASTIPAPLLDRMDVIELNSYTREEKFHIAKNHLVKKQIKANGLKASQMKLTDAAIYDLIDYYTKEAGVRTLERTIASLCRKAAKTLLTENVIKVQYTPAALEKALGPHKFIGDYYSKADTVGMVNGLAWTSVGGVLMPLEVLTMDGKGEIQVTGSLGDVMKESAKLAISYTRSVAKKYDINPELFKNKDIHIHAPEGAVPKDGPSAGVTMLTALVSAMSHIPVRHDIAMTGEITLHGKVLPIGGLVEKSMAAYKNGIRTVLIPAANLPDLAELDETVRNEIQFIPCETVETVLDTALIPPHYDLQLEPLLEEENERILTAIPQKKKQNSHSKTC
ncbi:MAG: endopeptidase La [Oscillospiraceae bacterium]|nr:endopeptidase La [Oscillospiraceae bacterium]